MNPNAIVAYLLLFSATGVIFLFAALLFGRFMRPHAGKAEKSQPHEIEKLQAYECGEPSIGSSYVQFDLRFYVVALVFLIFEVELAFFFPWATVFGQATQESRLAVAVAKGAESTGASAAALAVSENARVVARIAMVDMAVFFVVLLMGFAYVWNRGDLNWVRAIHHEPRATNYESVPSYE